MKRVSLDPVMFYHRLIIVDGYYRQFFYIPILCMYTRVGIYRIISIFQFIYTNRCWKDAA